MNMKELSQRVGKCANTTKYVLAVCFTIVFVLGLALFCAGLSARLSEKALEALHVPGIASLPDWGIALGVLMGVVALIGALGSCMLNRVMLLIFVGATTLAVVLQVSVGTAAYVLQDQYPRLLSEAWGSSENSTRSYLEGKFDCCGFYNTTDREYLPGCPGYVASSSVFSSSAPATREELASVIDPSSVSSNGGCESPLVDLAKSMATSVGIALICITVLEVAILIATGVLLYRIRTAQNRYAQFGSDSDYDDGALDHLQD